MGRKKGILPNIMRNGLQPHISPSAAASSSSQPHNNIADEQLLPQGMASSSSSTVPTVSDQTYNQGLTDLCHKIQTIAVTIDENEVDDYLDDLIQHISKLLELNKERKKQSKERGIIRCLPSTSTSFSKLKEFLSQGIDAAKEFITGDGKNLAKNLLAGLGSAHLVLAGFIVVANTLEILETRSANREECLRLMKEIYRLAQLVNELKTWRQLSPAMNKAIKEATELIVEGSIICCIPIRRRASFFSSSENKDKLTKYNKELDTMNTEISHQIMIADNTKAPLPRRCPNHAVGIEEPIRKVMDLFEGESNENAVAVTLYGFGGIGKSTLARAVWSELDMEGCRYSEVELKVGDEIISSQKSLLEQLMETKKIPEIKTLGDGQLELERLLQNVPAYIFIDNVSEAKQLRELLPRDLNNAKKVRLLLTARDSDACNSCAVKNMKFHPMEGLPPAQARVLLEREIDNRNAKKQHIDPSQLNEIIDMCAGIPIVLELVGAYVGFADDKNKAFRIVKEAREKMQGKPFEKIEHYVFAFDNLPDPYKEPFLDICSFFKGWNWEMVEDILGESALDDLQKRSLITKDANGVVNVHDVISTMGCEKAKETRFKFSSAHQIKKFLHHRGKEENQKTKGIWLSENKDLFHVPAIKLDSMYESLRILKLENLIKVDGECGFFFKKLIFFEGAVSSLPFKASECQELRYLAYQPTGLNPFEMLPPGLKHVDFDGRLHSLDFQISFRDLHQLKNLRILRLTQFEKLETLPDQLGHVVTGLQELDLSYCKSIQELPQSISQLHYLKVLRMSCCSSLIGLPKDFASLISLEELNLHGCTNLKELPRSFEKLSSLKILDLSSCKNLSKLPHRLGYLASRINLSLNKCDNLTRIPESIGRLKLSSSSMDMSCCSSLRELPSLFVQLGYLTELNLCECRSLQTLPQGFGQLKYLVELNLSKCSALEQLCHDFHCLSSLRILNLSGCERLEELPQNFHRLTLLENLDLSGCESLKNLTEDFHCLPSLHHLYLCSCHNLESKWMDNLVEIKAIQIIIIQGSRLLVNRWREIQRERNQLWSFAVYTGQDFSKEEKENILRTLLSELDCLLIDQQGNHFHISDLPLNTVSLVMFHSDPADDFPWPLIEETIDDIHIDFGFQMIYIGKHFNKLPKKVKNRIWGYCNEISKLGWMVDKFLLTLDVEVRDSMSRESWLERYNAEKPTYFEMKMVEGGRSCWKILSNCEVEEFVLSKCERYLKLKKLVETPQENNQKLFRELFATKEDEIIFQRNRASNKDPNSSKPFTARVEKLKGKTILLEMGCKDISNDIGLSFLERMYIREKKTDIEIISMPIVQPNTKLNVRDVFERLSTQVPWLVLKSPLPIARIVKYFLVKQSGWKGDDIWYPSIICIIESSGKISNCKPFEFLMLRMWKPKAYPFTRDRFEEFKRKESDQLKNMNLEFLLQSSPDQVKRVKEAMCQGKMICLCNGNREVSVMNALIEFTDSIHIIYIPRYVHKKDTLGLTDCIYKNFYSFQKPKMPQAEMKGMSLLNSEDEVIKFWMCLLYLKEQINGMDSNDQQLSEMRGLLDCFQPMEDRWMTFIDKDGNMVAAWRGEIMESFFRDDGKNRAKQLIKRLIQVSKKESDHQTDGNIHFPLDNMQIAATVHLGNVVGNLDNLSKYTSELLELLQLHQLSGIKKEEQGKSSRQKVTRHCWPPSNGLTMLKNFLSDGKTDDNLDIVIQCLVDGISDAYLAAACLLVVADILEGFQTAPAYENEWLTLLEEMNRLAEYMKQLNEGSEGEKYENMRKATMWIVYCSIVCCAKIEPSKFARFFKGPVSKTKVLALQEWLRRSREELPTLQEVQLGSLQAEFYDSGVFSKVQHSSVKASSAVTTPEVYVTSSSPNATDS